MCFCRGTIGWKLPRGNLMFLKKNICPSFMNIRESRKNGSDQLLQKRKSRGTGQSQRRNVQGRARKEGALSNCNNWRVTLLSVPSKTLARVITRRISEAVDHLLRQEQTDFWKARGCTDQIVTLRSIIEQCTEWQRQLYINYEDFEKAFDSIHRESLWRILRAYGIP